MRTFFLGLTSYFPEHLGELFQFVSIFLIFANFPNLASTFLIWPEKRLGSRIPGSHFFPTMVQPKRILGPNFSLVTKNPPFFRHHRVVRLINYGELPSKVWLTRDQWPHCCLIQSTPPSSLKRSILKRTQRQQRTDRERTQHFLLFITLNITIFK